MLGFALVEGFNSNVNFSEPVWLEAMPARLYHTPQYGQIPITPEKLRNFVQNFNDNVRGQEIAVDYDHGMDAAKGNKAAGWYKGFDIRPSSDGVGEALFANVQFTDEAQQEIASGAWKYFSLEWDDEWMDNAGSKYRDVITGGGITNRPIAKKVAALPINFSESAFNELDEETKKAVNKFTEEVTNAVKLLKDSGFTVTNEMADLEHSEPGTGDPPQRREGNEDDPAIQGGWRRDPLPLDPNDPNAPKPNSKGDTKVELTEEQIKELVKTLELPDDVTTDKFLEVVGSSFSEAKSLREAMSSVDEEKRFAESYPRVWAEQQALKRESRENKATSFSESVATLTRPEGEKFIKTGYGLSALVLDEIKNTHLKFAEGSAQLSDFEDLIKKITSGGIVKFGEEGSTVPSPDPPVVDTRTAQGIADARKLFAEKVKEIETEDKIDIRAAMVEAAKKYPELAKAYAATASA